MIKFQLREILNEEQLLTVDENACRILQDVGLIVEHVPSQEKLKNIRGVHTDGRLVRFEPDVVKERTADIGPATDYGVHVIAGCYAHNYMDPETEQIRPPTTDDLVKSIKQADALDMGVCAPVVPLADVPGPMQELVMERMTHEHSRYSLGGGQATTLAAAEAALEMSRVAGRSFGLELWVNSPLKIDGSNLDILWNLRHKRPPVHIANMPVRGMSGPIFLRDLMALSTAECLGAATLLNLLDITSEFSYRMDAFGMYSMDMRTMNVLLNGPDYLRLWLFSIEMCRHHGIAVPAAKALLTSAKLPDMQASAEKAAGAMAVAMAGTDCYMAAGALSTVEMYSPLQLIIDLEIMRFVDAVNSPVEFPDTPFDPGVVAEVGPGESFLGHETTVMNYRDAMWHTDMFSINPLSAWLHEGRPQVHEKARDILNSLKLRDEPVVSPEVQKELLRIERFFTSKLKTTPAKNVPERSVAK